MLTLNQIKKILKDWFNNHAMINSVYYEDDFDFNAERNILYPVTNIHYFNTVVNDNVMNHSYIISIGDRAAPDDSEMEDSIISDSVQVAEDFITFLQNYEGLILNRSTSIKAETDDTADRVAFIQFTITLGVVRPQNRCNTPTK